MRRKRGRKRLEKCLRDPNDIHRWEVPKVRKDGSQIWVRETARVVENADGKAHVLTVCEDVTEARKLSVKLAHQATHDGLTGLVNRAEFENRLRRVLDTARATETQHALCYLDLDQFKVINDTCGHVAGDELLRQLGAAVGQSTKTRYLSPTRW